MQVSHAPPMPLYASVNPRLKYVWCFSFFVPIFPLPLRVNFNPFLLLCLSYSSTCHQEFNHLNYSALNTHKTAEKRERVYLKKKNFIYLLVIVVSKTDCGHSYTFQYIFQSTPKENKEMSGNGDSGMRAVILVGGFGTRLRPLTLTTPKPLVPFCNKPMIIHQIEALKRAGVTEVILAVAYRPEAMKAEMDEWAEKLGVSFVFSVEEEPLGTAGPLSLARETLMQDDKPFFVLNSDVTCPFPMTELLEFHKSHGAEGTIVVSQVTQWEKYGVVVYSEETQQIDRFVEKPKEFVGDRINAGIYIFNKSVLDRIPPRRTSIEKEIFPKMAADKQLYAFNLEGFWMDVGQPKDYITGMGKYIPSLAHTEPDRTDVYYASKPHPKGTHFTVKGSAIIDPTATIGDGCIIGPNAVIGANCKIAAACRIDNSAIFENSSIGQGSYITDSIIGWNNRIGKWCHVESVSVLGDDVELKDGVVVHGVKVLPNKEVGINHFEPTIIM